MVLNTTPALLDSLYWITLFAVIVSSASAVLKAGFKQFDLFGVIIIAIATGLGGGSLRDMLLDREVFWIEDQVFFIASLASAIAIFLTARLVALSPKLFLIPDAAGLATFGIAGTLVSLVTGAPCLKGGLAYLDCRVVSVIPAGDNSLFLAEVVATRSSAGAPLIYHNQRYHQLKP